mmetsp:Transcript_10846/g.15294  ORF Transcript_10846/g.15294 Transcript_10846/m.15294 type:complete len:81 (-) Transcript_10846:773-1015(-)
MKENRSQESISNGSNPDYIFLHPSCMYIYQASFTLTLSLYSYVSKSMNRLLLRNRGAYLYPTIGIKIDVDFLYSAYSFGH